VTSFEAFKLYISLKNHFTQKKYNYFKYNGKSRTSQDSFDKRKDKIFFQKLSKHSDVLGFLLSNLLVNNKSWIKDITYNENSDKIYNDWLKRKQSLTYVFKNDIKKLDDDFNSNFLIQENNHPTILKLYLSNEISLETFCILIDISGAKKYFDKMLKNDVMWDEIGLLVEKYTPFITYDKEKYKNILLTNYE
jgi:hypothetical protein